MKILSYGKDGGPDSTVWGLWLIEWKRFFSIALLCFEDGSREEFHTHAFNSMSWVLKGKLEEELIHLTPRIKHTPSFKPIMTSRNTFHRVHSKGRTWVFTVRGPWVEKWKEFDPATDEFAILTHGRKVVSTSKDDYAS